jgi:hypothetical protein
MRRCSLIGLAVVIAFGFVLGSGVAATGGVAATFTRVRPNPPDTRVVVVWKLRDGSGQVVREKHVFVKITCPQGDRSTTTYANPDDHGVYLVSAVVPPGGVGTITVGHGSSVFPVTNPYHG